MFGWKKTHKKNTGLSGYTVRGAFQNHNALSDMSNYTREIAIKECYLPSLLSFSLLQSLLIEVKRFEKRR